MTDEPTEPVPHTPAPAPIQEPSVAPEPAQAPEPTATPTVASPIHQHCNLIEEELQRLGDSAPAQEIRKLLEKIKAAL